MHSPERRLAMGRAARIRVLDHFSWRAVAKQTLAFYGDLLRG
jgi:starch synthase